jgi:ATP-dependent protease HslVU (ClpYQ) peptidase subunit
MTVLVSVKINDGIVMAADSASSFESGMVYQNADKIVNLREGLPIGAMATGAGGIKRPGSRGRATQGLPVSSSN